MLNRVFRGEMSKMHSTKIRELHRFASYIIRELSRFHCICQLESQRNPEFCMGSKREFISLPRGALGDCFKGRTKRYFSFLEIGMSSACSG